MRDRKKLIRAVTVSQSVDFFAGMIPDLRRMGYEVVSVSSDGPELKHVRDAGGRTLVVEMQRHISPLRDLGSLCSMIRLFHREKPHMVHSMTPKAGLICMMAAKLTGVPVRVHTFTGLVFPTSTGLKRRLLMLTDRMTSACATHVIPEGEGVKNDLLQNGITDKPIRVLGHGNCRGINLVHFNPLNPDVREMAVALKDSHPRLNGDDGNGKPFTFIFIGRIVRDKGINELAAAFSRLYSERKDVRLILVGEYEENLDPISPESRDIIDSSDGIYAAGQQPDVRPWLVLADAFVFPSYREGFPNVVIEAGAMSLPSIVTDINGSKEIIIDGKNGVVIPPRDAESLYLAMKRLSDDSNLTRHLASQARPMIESRFEESFVRNCLYTFYNEIDSPA